MPSGQQGFTPSLRFAEHGFTLLETLVALSVLSIAALAMVRLDAFAVRSASQLSASSMAQVVAGNAATDALTDPAVPSSGSETVRNGGQTWQVARTVSPLGDAGAMRIDIAVRGTAGGQARLTLVRPATQEVAP